MKINRRDFLRKTASLGFLALSFEISSRIAQEARASTPTMSAKEKASTCGHDGSCPYNLTGNFSQCKSCGDYSDIRN